MIKIAIVTGANSGIGFAVAKGLLLKDYHVIMACRNLEKATNAKDKLIHLTKSSRLEIIPCDLSLKSSIEQFTQKFTQKYNHLDVLCNCAGNIVFQRKETSEGIEENFATNVLGPFHLSNLLIPALTQETATSIVNITGSLHRLFNINFDDLFYKKHFNPLRVGSISMLQRIMLTYELDKRLNNSKIAINCFHPGNVQTELMQKMPKIIQWLSLLKAPFQLTPDEGAKTCLWLIEQNNLGKNISGKYFIDCQGQKSSRSSYDQTAHLKLWAKCEELIG